MQNRNTRLVLVAMVTKSAFEQQEGIKLIPLEDRENDVKEILVSAERTIGVVTANPNDYAAAQGFERTFQTNLQPDGGCLAAHTVRPRKGTIVIAPVDRSQFTHLLPTAQETQWDKAIASTNFMAYSVVKAPRQANVALLGIGVNSNQPELAGGTTRGR